MEILLHKQKKKEIQAAMNLGGRILAFAIVGLIIGAIFGGISGASVGGMKTIIVAIVVWGLIGALFIGLLAFIPQGVWDMLLGLVALAECCSMFAILFGVSVVMISSFVIWHSVLLAFLIGISMIMASLFLLSVAAYAQKGKHESQPPASTEVALN